MELSSSWNRIFGSDCEHSADRGIFHWLDWVYKQTAVARMYMHSRPTIKCEFLTLNRWLLALTTISEKLRQEFRKVSLRPFVVSVVSVWVLQSKDAAVVAKSEDGSLHLFAIVDCHRISSRLNDLANELKHKRHCLFPSVPHITGFITRWSASLTASKEPGD